MRVAFHDVRRVDDSFAKKYAEERRLCGIIESVESSADEKYEALVELAYLSGVLVCGALENAA